MVSPKTRRTALIAKVAVNAVFAAAIVLTLSSSPGAAQMSGAFEAFGGKAGLDRVADRGIDRVLQDPRIKDRFTSANIPRLKAMLSEQFCALLDGPCTYTGRDMKTTHAGMGLKDKDFNALAEDFQRAMDDVGIPFRYQNILLAKLAPMDRDIAVHE